MAKLLYYYQIHTARFTSLQGNKTRRPLVLYVKKVRYLPM